MARADIPTSTLFEEINKFIPEELQIFTNVCKALRNLGINLEANIATTKHGFYATTFLVPQKNIVIKFFGKECEESNVRFPNDSRYLLQSFCHTDVIGNQLAIFPLLKTSGVTKTHADELCDALDAEGYFFSDSKLENIGLTVGGIPYVIDNDAARKVSDLAAPESRRGMQWEYIDPAFSLDHTPTEKSCWEIDPVVQEKMFVLGKSLRPLDAEKLMDLEKESETPAKL
jgi:hypothetical protein